MTTTTEKKVELDERFKFGPPPIQTAEDARMAYLREEITEAEFVEACGRYGVLPGHFTEAIPLRDTEEKHFRRDLPKEMAVAAPEVPDVEHQLKLVEAKQNVRDEALEKTEDRAEKFRSEKLNDPNLTADEANALVEKHMSKVGIPEVSKEAQKQTPEAKK